MGGQLIAFAMVVSNLLSSHYLVVGVVNFLVLLASNEPTRSKFGEPQFGLYRTGKMFFTFECEGFVERSSGLSTGFIENYTDVAELDVKLRIALISDGTIGSNLSFVGVWAFEVGRDGISVIGHL